MERFGTAGTMRFSDRALDRLYSFILLVVVLLSWGFVIYGARIAAKWQLENKLKMQA